MVSPYFSYLSWGFPRIVITLSPNVQVVNEKGFSLQYSTVICVNTFTIYDLIFENNIASTSKNYKMYKKTRPSYRKIGFYTREKHFMLNLYVPPSRALKIDSRADSTIQIMLCS